MKWHFSPQPSDQVETEVTQRDQFNNDDVDISETIVRETIQNSLDAAIDDPCKVKVMFRWLTENDGLSSKFFKSLFEGQTQHAEIAEVDVNSLDFKNPSALVIEDFGTRGLLGKTAEKDNKDFSDFWRRHGKSHKTGKSRGRWGLGKLVFSVTSRIGVFFGVTRRADDPKVYLMGQTVLNVREINGDMYPAHAFFADVDNEKDYVKRITVPVKDEKFVDEFIENFSLDRRENPGLSVVIPFPNESFSIEKMIEVGIGNYFYPIITGQLVLVFGDIEITADNVRELAKQYAANRFAQIDILFDFIEEIYKAEQGDLLKLKSSWLDDRKLDENDFDPETLETIRETFAKGEVVGLYLPVTIKPKNEENEESGFSVYIKRPAELKKGLDMYVRGGLTLPAESKFYDRRALGAMIAEHKSVCGLLGDAENAAHTKWISNTEKLRRNYRSPHGTITVIKKSVVQLYDLLAEVSDDVDEDALQDFFWFNEPESGKKKRRKKPKPPIPIPPIKPSQPLMSLSQTQGGFTLSSTDAFTEDKLPREVRIEVAYDTANGNPYAAYSPYDFKTGKNGNIKVKSKDNIKVVSAEGNKWVFEIVQVPFKLKVRGFDENRDLKVKFR